MGKKKPKRIPIRYKFAGEEKTCALCYTTDLERDENGDITNGVMCEGGEGPPYDNEPNLQAPHFICSRCLCFYIRSDIQEIADVEAKLDPYDTRSLIEKLSTFCEDRNFRCVFHHRRGGTNVTFRCPGLYLDTQKLIQIVGTGEEPFCQQVSQDMNPDNICDTVLPSLRREKDEEERRQQERLVAQRAREEQERKEEVERIRKAEEEAEKAAKADEHRQRIAQRNLEIQRALQNVRVIIQTLERKPDLTMKCPNCNALLADWDGCGQMKCDNCGVPFCIICGEMFPNDEPPGYHITHMHVTDCPYRSDIMEPHRRVAGCPYRADLVDKKNPRSYFVPGNVALHGRLFKFQKEFNNYLASIQDENIKNAVILILRRQLESEFEKLFPHRHDNLRINQSECTIPEKHKFTPNLPDFQRELLRKYRKDFLSLLRTGTGVCMPDSWYYFVTYPEPQRNRIVDQMVDDYYYFKQHKNVTRPEIPPLDQQGQQAQQAQGGFFSRSYQLVTNKIKTFFGYKQENEEQEEKAAVAAVVYHPHPHPLNKTRLIAGARLGNLMACDSCGQPNQPAYIGCSEGCNYHECIECAIKHGYILEQEATEELDKLYLDILPEDDIDDDEDNIALTIAALNRADQQARLTHQQLRQDFDREIALQLQQEEEDEKVGGYDGAAMADMAIWRQEEARREAEQLARRRQEQMRQEQIRQEQIRQERLRQEQIRQEQIRQEQIRQEQIRQERLRQEAEERRMMRIRQAQQAREAEEARQAEEEARRQAEEARQAEEEARRQAEEAQMMQMLHSNLILQYNDPSSPLYSSGQLKHPLKKKSERKSRRFEPYHVESGSAAKIKRLQRQAYRQQQERTHRELQVELAQQAYQEQLAQQAYQQQQQQPINWFQQQQQQPINWFQQQHQQQ